MRNCNEMNFCAQREVNHKLNALSKERERERTESSLLDVCSFAQCSHERARVDKHQEM
jgi:hypothetical protein